LLGQKDHNEVLSLYSNYLAFILPSYPETFGLVLIEALNGGLPIIYAERSGVDGYFDGLLLGIKVPWNKTHKIERAVEEIFLNKDSYSQTVREYVGGGGLEIFSQKSVSEKYTRLLTKLLEV
jgi:glycosyltransferase involved in cell wall biosynthesis